MRTKVFGILLCAIMLGGCGSGQNISSDIKKPSIPVLNNTFDVTVDECIEILNTNLEKEELGLIPAEYVIIENERETVYKSTINNRLMIRFIITKDESDGIMRIGLSYLKDAEYDSLYNNKTINDSGETEKVARQYYQIVCDNINPRISVKKFIGKLQGYDSVAYTRDDRVFNYGLRSINGIGGREDVYIYEVISSEEIYNKYVEEIDEDTNVFFKDIDEID